MPGFKLTVRLRDDVRSESVTTSALENPAMGSSSGPAMGSSSGPAMSSLPPGPAMSSVLSTTSSPTAGELSPLSGR